MNDHNGDTMQNADNVIVLTLAEGDGVITASCSALQARDFFS